MNSAAWMFLAIWVMTFAVLCYVHLRWQNATEAVRHEAQDHERCHRHTIHALKIASRNTGAMALEIAAERYDSVEEKDNLRILARENVSLLEDDGASLPAVWLRQQAKKLLEEN